MRQSRRVADNELDELAGWPEKDIETMRITRRFTQAGTDVFSTIEWTKRSSRINNADGSVVFEMQDAEVPAEWSQLATDIMVSKYFRKLFKNILYIEVPVLRVSP